MATPYNRAILFSVCAFRAGLWLCGALGQKYFVGPHYTEASHKPFLRGNKIITYKTILVI